MYQLIIANKNYSSWSLRPWLLLKQLKIPFTEELVPFGTAAFGQVSPTGKVPCLVDGSLTVWDSLAIIEYVAEKDQAVWPSSRQVRAWARSAAAEMHSGFGALRQHCTMNVGIRVRINTLSTTLKLELERLDHLWCEGLRDFGGPFLAGERFTAVDAFYAPVCFRIKTYGLELSVEAAAYADRLLSLEPMREWYASAIAELWRDDAHEREANDAGTLLADLRAK
jgi:glutathione S-transferase